MEKDWHEIFVYDESSPTNLRWKHPRIGRGGSLVKRVNNGVAGGVNKEGSMVVNVDRVPTMVSRIVWEMFNSRLEKGDEVMYLDGNKGNTKISNLYLFTPINKDHKYGSYLGEYLEYDTTSPSCLRWKKKYWKGSNVSIGDVAGSLDKTNGYWKLNALGCKKEVHKVVWALFNNFEDQTGKQIDHIDGNPLNNRIENLRLVPKELNARNQKRQHNSKTGINGVVYCELLTKKGTPTSRYTATVYKGGKRVSKTFSVRKYGKEAAKSMAIAWREREIKKLKEEGYGYTKRHGADK